MDDYAKFVLDRTRAGQRAPGQGREKKGKRRAA
jgi:ATP-binding cassette subfamily F protein 3